jgi:hypothetical protein
MHKPTKAQQFKPKYKYVTTEIEAAYAIKKNPDAKKYAELQSNVNKNNHFCPVKEKLPENRCMCEQFLNRNSEGFCKYKLFYKEARTEKAAEAYFNAEATFNEKKEKEIEKEVDREEAARTKFEDET